MLTARDPIIFEPDSELSVEEKIRRIVEEKERCDAEGWTIMPRLFDIWDADSSGTLDKNEVFMGVEQYCEAREISFDSRVISRLWCDVDDNGDQYLDRHEFAVFLARYCEEIGIALDDLAFVVLEQLAGVASIEVDSGHKKEDPGAVFHKFWVLSKRQPVEVRTWAQLKIESEKLCNDPTPGTELGNVGHALKHVSDSTVCGKPESVAGYLSRMNFSKSMLPPVEVRKRRHSNIRPLKKIEAKSLDDFFCGVDKAVKRSESQRMKHFVNDVDSCET